MTKRDEAVIGHYDACTKRFHKFKDFYEAWRERDESVTRHDEAFFRALRCLYIISTLITTRFPKLKDFFLSVTRAWRGVTRRDEAFLGTTMLAYWYYINDESVSLVQWIFRSVTRAWRERDDSVTRRDKAFLWHFDACISILHWWQNGFLSPKTFF